MDKTKDKNCFAVDAGENSLILKCPILVEEEIECCRNSNTHHSASIYHRFERSLSELATSLARRNDTT